MSARALLRHWLVAAALVFAAAQAAAATPPAALEARAQALRVELASHPTASRARGELLARQLLASLERRIDLQRARDDARRLAASPRPAAPPPRGLLEVDALRRDLQQIDATLASGNVRLELMRQERLAAARQLEKLAAALRQRTDAGGAAGTLANTRLEAQLAECGIAEIDLLLEVGVLQQELARQRRRAQVRRLVAVDADAPVPEHDVAALRRSLDARLANLQLRLSAAIAGRQAARAKLPTAGGDDGAFATDARIEALANHDIDIELTREAIADLAIEREAWEITLRYRRAGDAAALVEARERGPAVQARLQRRREFLRALSEQLLGRLGSLDAELSASTTAAEAAGRQQLRALFAARLQRVQAALLDERQLSLLIERLRADFDRQVESAPLREQVALVVASTRASLLRSWNFELFSVQEAIEVEGRKTQVAHGVTIGKLVEAPLLLLVGGLLTWRLTGWGALWLQRRRGMDEARARLLRRWVALVLVGACTVASLLLAGIPLAAFAFVGGAVAIGAGIGTQTLFKNLVSGVLVLAERPFRLGDVIEIGALRGTVVDIDLRASVLRDDEGAETLVPNSTLIEQNVRNLSQRAQGARQSIAVQVAHTAPPRLVMDSMRESAARHGQLLESPAPEVLLEDCAGDGLSFVMHYWLAATPGVERRRIASDLRLMVLGAFEESGIALATPSRRE